MMAAGTAARHRGRRLAAIAGVAMLAACGGGPGVERAGGTATAEEAAAFLEKVDAEMLDLGIALSRALVSRCDGT